MLRWISACLVVLALGPLVRAENDLISNRTDQNVLVKITHETSPIYWIGYIGAYRSDTADLDFGPRHMVVSRWGSEDILASADFTAYRTGTRNITIRRTTDNIFWIDVGPWRYE